MITVKDRFEAGTLDIGRKCFHMRTGRVYWVSGFNENGCALQFRDFGGALYETFVQKDGLSRNKDYYMEDFVILRGTV